jgi:hypothetical protein
MPQPAVYLKLFLCPRVFHPHAHRRPQSVFRSENEGDEEDEQDLAGLCGHKKSFKKSLRKLLHSVFTLINYALLVAEWLRRTALFADR